MFQNFTFDAGGRQINAGATFIRYEAETGGAVNPAVRVRADGQDLGEWLPGDSVELPCFVSLIELAPVAGAVGSFRTGNGKINVNRVQLAGNVGASITAQKNTALSTFVNTQKTVTNTSSQLASAKADRQYLLIQNKDASGSIYVVFGGAANLNDGLRIGPGGFWEWDSTVSTQAIFAIGDVASNANIVLIQG